MDATHPQHNPVISCGWIKRGKEQHRAAAPHIERFWKLFKRQVLYNSYYEAFDDYKNACKQFFQELDSHASKLRSLLTFSNK